MNKFIHPRNIYKQHPNFTDLAAKYPEFREITKLDIYGKVVMDFKDEAALTTLTKTLLKDDFDLDVKFIPNRLVPTLPLRLNYVLWLEDIIQYLGLTNCRGIDIGCGASCIYPLLCVRKNNWTMTGLEVDEQSISTARSNVSTNKLEDKITIIEQDSSESEIFSKIFSQSTDTFDFCMCNPPFFDEEDSEKPAKNRTGNRPPPRNAKTGSNGEMMCPGGEMAFVRKIVQESLVHRDRIKVYTTMVGVKNDFIMLVKELRNSGITNFIETEFCQGRTTRWGLAWTFAEDLYLRTVPCIQSAGQKSPTLFLIPECDTLRFTSKMELVKGKILEFCKEIDIIPEVLNEIDIEIIWRIKANIASWTNTRRKRREHLQSDSKETNYSESNGVSPKRLKLSKPILTVDLTLSTVDSGHTIQVEYLDGELGKDGAQQILQYFVNKFNKFF